MKIKIEKKNEEKIQNLLVEKRGKLENQLDYSDIIEGLQRFTKKNILSKKDTKGTKFFISGFWGSLAKSYKYKKEFIQVCIEVGTNGFYLVSIIRVLAHPNQNIPFIDVDYSAQQKNAIKEKLLINYLNKF